MPEKTHRRGRDSCRGLKLLLELHRRLVAKRRVQTAAIIVIVDEGLDVFAQVLKINVIVSIDLFALERLHKTLTTGIVVWIRRPTHARNHLVRL